MPYRVLTPGNSYVVGPEMNAPWLYVVAGKAVVGGFGGRIQGRAVLTPGETLYTNTVSGCSGGANGTGGPGAGRDGGDSHWFGRTSSAKTNAILVGGGGGGRGGGGSGGGDGGQSGAADTEATGATNCTAGAAGNIGQGGGGGGGRGWRGGAGGGANAGNGTGGTNMYRTTIMSGVVSEAGVGSTTTGALAIYWSRTFVGIVSETTIVTLSAIEIACCGAMI